MSPPICEQFTIQHLTILFCLPFVEYSVYTSRSSKSSSRRCKEGIEREGGLEKRAEPPRQLWRWKKREEGDLGDEKWPQLSQKKKRRRKISMMMMERV